MKISNIFFALFVSVAILSCNETKKNTEPEVITVETTPEVKIYEADEIVAEFKDQAMTDLFKSYINLKTALVNTNATVTSAAALAMINKMQDMKASEEALSSLAIIAKTGDIEEQRKEFVMVTESVEGMVKNQLESGTVYKQFCPMAFGNKGAYWLSSSKDIMNPYFGDKMLKCGRIAEEIK